MKSQINKNNNSGPWQVQIGAELEEKTDQRLFQSWSLHVHVVTFMESSRYAVWG